VPAVPTHPVGRRAPLNQAFSAKCIPLLAQGEALGILHLRTTADAAAATTFGHDAGDALLRELGSLLQSQVRGSDIACRYGGEEFAVILPDAPLAAAQERADAIRKSAKHIDLKHHGQALGAITLSIGVSVFPDHGDASFSLLRTADQALYRAKAAGRDCVVLAETPAPTTPSPS
jgi:diguanylate cyclase (GGDEF)-like protein